MTLSYERQWILHNDTFLRGKLAMAILKIARQVISEDASVPDHDKRRLLALNIVQNPWGATPLFLAYVVSHPALTGNLTTADITDAMLDAAITEVFTWVAVNG